MPFTGTSAFKIEPFGLGNSAAFYSWTGTYWSDCISLDLQYFSFLEERDSLNSELDSFGLYFFSFMVRFFSYCRFLSYFSHISSNNSFSLFKMLVSAADRRLFSPRPANRLISCSSSLACSFSIVCYS